MKKQLCSVAGIKCDNPECDYRDDTATYEEYDKWLNKPCPKCGENLLTEADLEATKLIVEAARALQSEMTPEEIKEIFEKNQELIRVEFNGTGFEGATVKTVKVDSKYNN